MKYLLFVFLVLFSSSAFGQGVGQGFTPSFGSSASGVVDSTRLDTTDGVQVLRYYTDGVLVGKDTIEQGSSEEPKTVRFLGLGQSNMAGRTGGETSSHPQILRAFADGSVEMATLANSNLNDPLWQFSKRYILDHPLDTVVMYLSAVGNTSISAYAPGGNNRALTETLLAAHGNPAIDVILWHQGESDQYLRAGGINANNTGLKADSAYYDYFYANVFPWMQSISTPFSPVILGEVLDKPSDVFHNKTVNGGINRIGSDTITNTLSVASAYLDDSDGVHFTGGALGDLGALYYAAWKSAPYYLIPSPAASVLDIQFNASDDTLTLLNVDSTEIKTKLRDVSLSPNTYYVAESGFSSSPQPGNLRKAYSMSDALTQTYGVDDKMYLLPGNHTPVINSSSSVRNIVGDEGSVINGRFGGVISPTISGRYSISSDIMTASVAAPFSFHDIASTIDVDFRTAIVTGDANGQWFRSADGRHKYGTLRYSGQNGQFIGRVQDSYRLEVDNFILDYGQQSLTVHAPVQFAMFGDANGAKYSANIENLKLKYELSSELQVSREVFQISRSENRITGNNISAIVHIDEIEDLTTGLGAIVPSGESFNSDYYDSRNTHRGNAAATLAAMGETRSSGSFFSFSVNRGRMRMPVIITKTNSISTQVAATNTTYNVKFGDIVTSDFPAVGVDPPLGVTGRVNLHADNIVQESDEALIKIGNNDIDTINISGRWHVQADHPVIFSNGMDLHLIDCHLTNEGISNLIEANSAITVYCYGSTYIDENDVNANVTIVYINATVQDDMGSHLATQALDMGGFQVTNALGALTPTGVTTLNQIARGQFNNITTDANGLAIIPHAFGAVPTAIAPKARGPVFYHVQVASKTTTNFAVKVFWSDGTPAANESFGMETIMSFQ